MISSILLAAGRSSRMDGENKLVKEVTSFILKDKKRPICSPLSKE